MKEMLSSDAFLWEDFFLIVPSERYCLLIG